MNAPNRTPQSERGFAFEGPGFYVWDEDLDVARRAALDLRRELMPVRRPARMLWIGPGAASLQRGDSEALDT